MSAPAGPRTVGRLGDRPENGGLPKRSAPSGPSPGPLGPPSAPEGRLAGGPENGGLPKLSASGPCRPPLAPSGPGGGKLRGGPEITSDAAPVPVAVVAVWVWGASVPFGPADTAGGTLGSGPEKIGLPKLSAPGAPWEPPGPPLAPSSPVGGKLGGGPEITSEIAAVFRVCEAPDAKGGALAGGPENVGMPAEGGRVDGGSCGL
jgi:hypothetical protein